MTKVRVVSERELETHGVKLVNRLPGEDLDEPRWIVKEAVLVKDVRRLLDLEELIDQLAFAHRELQRLEEKGIDDTGNLEDRIEANRELQRAVETLRETIGAEDSAPKSGEGDTQ